MPSTDDYRLQDILCRACGNTAQSSDSASALKHDKIKLFREAYMLDINELDAMQLTYTIDCYNRCRLWKLQLMPNHGRMLYHHDDSDHDARQDIWATGMDGRWSMRSEVDIWRMGSLLVVFLFLSSLPWILDQYQWRRYGFLPPSESDKWR